MERNRRSAITDAVLKVLRSTAAVISLSICWLTAVPVMGQEAPKYGDRGVPMAFRETDGEFLWQQTHVKLEAGRANDWPFPGVASSPLVEGHRHHTERARLAL